MKIALLLLVIVYLTVADAQAKSVRVCEHSPINLKCNGGLLIGVKTALYGRKTLAFCTRGINRYQLRNLNCRAGGSLAKVKQSCQNRNSCRVHASNGVFGDPCFGTYKYLQVTYECINTGGNHKRILAKWKLDGTDKVRIGGARVSNDPNSGGKALYFNGGNSKGYMPAVRFQTTSFTISFWIKPLKFNRMQTLIGDWVYPWQFLLRINSGNRLHLTLRRNIKSHGSLGDQDLISVSGGNVAARENEWQHVVVVWNKDTGKASLYLNDVLVGQKVTSRRDRNLQMNTHQFYQLGWKGDSRNEFYHGYMKDLTIYGYDAGVDANKKPDVNINNNIDEWNNEIMIDPDKM